MQVVLRNNTFLGLITVKACLKIKTEKTPQ